MEKCCKIIKFKLFTTLRFRVCISICYLILANYVLDIYSWDKIRAGSGYLSHM